MINDIKTLLTTYCPGNISLQHSLEDREAETLPVFLLLTLSPRPGSHAHAIPHTHHSFYSFLCILALCLLKSVPVFESQTWDEQSKYWEYTVNGKLVLECFLRI